MRINGNAAPKFRAAKKSTELELFVYDAIGASYWGISPSDVQSAIKEAGTITGITVHVNSPGGDSFDGIAIHNIIRQQNVPVTVVVEGLAASAAFTVAMSGDKIQVAEASMMMLHNAWFLVAGDAAELRKYADLLDKHSGTMRDMYAKRSGMASEAVQSLMDAETWLTADEAIAKGFATEKLATTPEKTSEAKSLAAQFDLAKFCSKVPESLKAEADASAATDALEHELSTAPDADAISRDIEMRRRQLELVSV